jgi:maltose-binding protein MalE
MKRTLVTLIALLVVASMALTACGAKATPVATQAATTAPTTGATLTIWADDTRTPLLQALAADFEAATGVTLEITDMGRVQDIRTPVITSSPAGEGPDIFIGVHDWLGALVDSGLVEPIDLGDKAADFIPSTLEAFTYTDGNLYGLPYAYENLGFFYNTDYVTTPPTTWDDVLAQARVLKAAGTIDYAFGLGDGLFGQYPIWDSFGGYVFGKDANGAWNTNDVGLDSPGFVAGLEFIGAAAAEGLVPTTTDNTTTAQLFETGRSAFLLGGPWLLEEIRASAVNGHYAITNFPGGGNPFSGVQGFLINAFSENKLLAQTFLTEYVATESFQQQLYDNGDRPSAWKTVVVDNPDLLAMGEAGANAVPMPSIPEMGSVWTAANNMVSLVISGQQTAQAAATEAATQVRNLISGAFLGKVTLPGAFGKQVGCGADWDPACTQTIMDLGADGLYHKTLTLNAGDYEYKVALDGSWNVSYGAADGSNFKVTVAADGTAVEFVYDPATNLCTTTP